MYTKKQKGDIGLAKAIAELTCMDVHVSLPLSEHLKYDIIGEYKGILKRIQVRYTTAKNNKIEIKLKSVWSNKKGNHILLREKGDFDILAAYCPNTNKVYFLDDKTFDNTTAITLRLQNQVGGNQFEVRMANNYIHCLPLFVN
jgi:hypothetical protein